MRLCDFCSQQPVCWSYPCQDFEFPEGIGSVGAWAACAECARLIDTDQREALAQRAVHVADRNLIFGWTGPTPIPEEAVIARMRDVHARFFAHRHGEPVPVGVN